MRTRFISQIVAIIVVLSGIAVMAGWIFDVPLLKSILPEWVTMKFITALSFFASGILLMFLAKKEKGEASKFFILIISFTLFLLMVTFLISLFTGVGTGIESLFVKEAGGAVRTAVPGVPAIPTIICFILIAFTGLIFSLNPKIYLGFFLMGMLVFLAGAAAVSGYLANIPILYYSFPGYTSMALPTSILFVLIGVGLVLIKREDNK